MRLKVSLYAAVLLLIFFNIPEADQERITINYPPDKVIMEFGLLSVSLTVPAGSADKIQARVNDNEMINITPDQVYECFSVPLKLGINKIYITAIKDGNKIFDETLSVFLRSDLVGEFSNSPADFRKDYFHMKGRPRCAECHKLEPKEFDKTPVSPTSFVAEAFDRKTVIEATSTCYSCHKKIAASPYVHGPVVVWSCLSCHDKDSEPKYSVGKPDAEVCFGCHIEQKNEWTAQKYMHGPVTIGKCAICHSPHSAKYPFNLYKPTWDLCVNCHAEKGSGKHVLGDAFSSEGHPTKGRPDPLRIGKEMTCASCHNPHASNFPHLWAFEVNDMFELCRKCHFDK